MSEPVRVATERRIYAALDAVQSLAMSFDDEIQALRAEVETAQRAHRVSEELRREHEAILRSVRAALDRAKWGLLLGSPTMAEAIDSMQHMLEYRAGEVERLLASETRLRAALLALEWEGDCGRCPCCGRDSKYEDDDIDKPYLVGPQYHDAHCIYKTITRTK